MTQPSNRPGVRLLPCPFCGGEMMFRKALWPSDGNTDAIIHAKPTSCGLSDFDTGSTDESVIDAWNTRPLTAPEKPRGESGAGDLLIGELELLKTAIDEGDPHSELFIRIGDALKLARAALLASGSREG